MQAVTFGEHPTHFILIALYTGYANESENGYWAVAMPKKKFTFERFCETAKQVLSPMDEQILGAEVFWTNPGNTAN